ncbi:MAG: type II secretion system F family protein [Micropruina sp.]
MMIGWASLLMTAAVWLAGPPTAVHRLRPAPRSRGVPRARAPVVLGVVVVLAPLLGAALGELRGAVLGWVVGVTGAAVAWTTRQARAGRRRSAVRDEVSRGCGELAGLLRVGYPPGRALDAVARASPLLAEVAAHRRVGGDVADALRAASHRPGASGLAPLAASWTIAERTGAAMATSLDDLATNLAAERDLARTVTTEVAAARLTGRLLGLLPLVGLGLGYAVGGDPIGYLVGSPAGLGCLTIGAALAAAGLVWSDALADRAGRLR